MNKLQVIILWFIAIALGAAVATVKISHSHSIHSATNRSSGQKLFKSFPATDITRVNIKGAESAVTLQKKDGNWTVAQRDDYPANTTYVNELIRTLNDLKVTQGIEAGPSFAPRFGMDASSPVAAEHGLIISFSNSSGKELAQVSIGKTIENNSAMSPMGGGGAVGRYIRNDADNSGFYVVSEMFPSVSAEPQRWLADSFISPEKIKSVSVSLPDKDETAWTLTRETEQTEFELAGASKTEALAHAATSALSGIFSYAHFEDVVPKNKLIERTATAGKRTATIQTFEGFTYKITLAPTKVQSATPTAIQSTIPMPTADNYLVTVDVQATLPKTRKKENNEKPEEAKSKDIAFADRYKILSEKLEKERALADRVFEVSKSTVEPLLKDRAALLEKPTHPANEGAPHNGVIQKTSSEPSRFPTISAKPAPVNIPTDKNSNR
jgi:hypothetical protein